MKYNCTEGKHKYSRQGICDLCNTKNPKLWGATHGSTWTKGMPQFEIKFALVKDVGVVHTTIIRATARYTAETRINNAIRDLFGNMDGGKIIEIKQIKGNKK